MMDDEHLMTLLKGNHFPEQEYFFPVIVYQMTKPRRKRVKGVNLLFPAQSNKYD